MHKSGDESVRLGFLIVSFSSKSRPEILQVNACNKLGKCSSFPESILFKISRFCFLFLKKVSAQPIKFSSKGLHDIKQGSDSYSVGRKKMRKLSIRLKPLFSKPRVIWR